MGSSLNGVELVTLVNGHLEVTNHIEGLLGVLISGTIKHSTEGLGGVSELYKFTGNTREHFGDSEGLGKELNNLSGSDDGESLLFRQLVHTKNGNNILEGSVILDELLDRTSNIVVSRSDDGDIEDSGGGLKRIDSGIDTKGGEVSGQHSVSIQVSECSGRSGIGEIISWYIDGLDRGLTALGIYPA